MHCSEKGVLPPSEYFFFPEDRNISRFYYHIPVLGHFFCDDTYSIERRGGVSPLLFCILNGSLQVKTEKASVCAKEGQVVLIDCSKYHHYYCDSNCEFLFTHFTGKDSTAITNFLTNEGKKIIFSDENEKIQGCLADMISALHAEKDVSVFCLAGMISSILNSLPENNYSKNSTAPLPQMQHPAMERAQNFIRTNLTKNITLDEIASNSNVSKYHLCKIFNELLGISPIEYVSQAKINLAETMLLTTNHSVSTIAELLSYSSAASFINAFRTRKNITPDKYRNKRK